MKCDLCDTLNEGRRDNIKYECVDCYEKIEWQKLKISERVLIKAYHKALHRMHKESKYKKEFFLISDKLESLNIEPLDIPTFELKNIVNAETEKIRTL